MTEFVVDPSSNSFEQSLNDLETFKNSKPELDTWVDSLDSGAGRTLLELIAGLDTSLKYNNTVNRRETYRNFALNRSSVIAGSEDDGYSAFRGQNVHFTLTVTPTTNVFINKFDVIGTVKDQDLIALEEKNLILGSQETIQVVAGLKASEEKTIGSPNVDIFRFLESSKVSEDIRLLLNGSEVPISKEIEDLLPKDYLVPPEPAKYVLLSNPFDSVDAYFLNFDDYVYKYDTGDVLTLEYIELKDFSYSFPNDFAFDYGTLDSLTVDTNYIPPEDINSIKTNSILFNQTRFVVKGRDDYIKQLSQLDPSFIDTNARDISPAVMEATYIKEVSGVLVLLTPSEKSILEDQLLDFRFFGNKPPPIIDPEQANIQLDIALKFFSNVSAATLNTDIAEIFAYQHGDNEINEAGRIGRREKKLGHTLNLSQMEHEFVNLPYVQIARITLITGLWSVSTPYLAGSIVKASPDVGLNFVCVVPGSSGVIQPDFNTAIAGSYVIEGIPEWQPLTSYNIGDTVISTIYNNRAYRVKNVLGVPQSSPIEPVWSDNIGDTYQDNNILWETISPEDIEGYLVWKSYLADDVEITLDWNQYFILNFSGTVTPL
jgi:hypothetical protein